MNAKKDGAPGLPDLDRQTREVMSPWFASRTTSPPPPSIMAGVQERVPTTRRRAGWRIADWWLWRRSDGRRAGFVLATAASVVLLSVVGLSSAGVFMVAQVDGPGPAANGAGAAPASPDHAPTQGDVEATAEPDPAAAEATPVVVATEGPEPAVVATEEPAAPMMAEMVVTDVAGSLTGVPTVVADGTATSSDGVTEVTGTETEAVVEFADERLSGTERTIRNELRFGAEGDGVVARGTISIENDGGSWTGRFESVTPPGRPGALRAVELSGKDGYEGLTAMLHYDLAKAWGDPEMITGVVTTGQRPAVPEPELFDYYAAFGDDLEKPKLREPKPRDTEGLPAVVAGSMETTVPWLTDHYDFLETSPELQTMPEWMAADLLLGDERLKLTGYEIMVNTDYPVLYENGTVSIGLSKGTSEDGGAWRGRVRVFSSPDEDPLFLGGRHIVTQLTGTGAYEGLSAILFSEPNPAVEDPDPTTLEHLDSWSVEGMLFEGGLPRYPDAAP